MFTITKYNRVMFNVDTTDFEYCKLSDLFNDPSTVYDVDGLLLMSHKTKSQFNNVSPVIICSDLKKLVNIPIHMEKIFREILQDDEAIDAIKGGRVGFKIRKYTDKYGSERYSINFIDK